MAVSQHQNEDRTNKKVNTASGRHRPKVKSACRTCKLRKVKCDEGRPSCSRCIKAGRICEGYGIWGGGTSSLQQSDSSASSPDSSGKSQRKIPMSRHGRSVAIRDASSQFVCSGSPVAVALSPVWPGHGDVIDVDPATYVLVPSDFLSVQAREYLPGPIPSIITVSPSTPVDRSMLSWFQDITASKLPGLFSSEFWHILLPQACYSEPAVLYGVLALTSAHKNDHIQYTPGQVSIEEKFTLESYSKAIRHLEPHLHVDGHASLRITLMACVLFACLEMVRQRYATAVTHLSSGLKLITQSDKTEGGLITKAYFNDHASDLISNVFLTLSLQVNLLGHRHFQANSIFTSHDKITIPPVFHSVEQAREHLDQILAQALHLANICRTQEHKLNSSTISARRHTIQTNLATWHVAYTLSALETDTTIPPRSRAATIVLRMYHSLACLIALSCTVPRRETIFDSPTAVDHFLAILTHAVKMWRIVRAWHAYAGPREEPGAKGAIVDIGWIAAVFYAVIKCRVERLRRHALRLLESTFHTEGVWDAVLTARVAREVIRIEERDMEGQLFASDQFALEDIPRVEQLGLPIVPEERRVFDVEIVHSGDGQGRVELLCCRRRGDGSWARIHREYDPDTQTWMDVT